MVSEVFDDVLDNFHRASLDEQPEGILKEFLRFVIRDGGLSEAGSVLIYNKDSDTLDLFNPGDFLFTEGFLSPGASWAMRIPSSKGMAGVAFKSRETKFSNAVDKDRRYSRDVADSPIKCMICVPIIYSFSSQPIGVVSFHSATDARNFDDHDVRQAQRSVAILGTCLRAASRAPFRLPGQKIFMIHGRDKNSLGVLSKLLKDRDVQVQTLGDIPRTGFELLTELESQIENTDAVLVLMTPDDEGRLRDGAAQLEPRARENVIFEAGMACALYRRTKRICFFVVGNTNIPSDIKGLLWEQFDPGNPDVGRLEAILNNWGFRRKATAQANA
jgi:predicted nucleotide-binding protein